MEYQQLLKKIPKNPLKNYFNLSNYLGASFGAGLAGTSAFIAYVIKDSVTAFPYILNGGDISQVFLNSTQEAYKVAGQWASLGALAGGFLTKKLKDWFLSALKR